MPLLGLIPAVFRSFNRAGIFLDPWNTAYWVRDNCADDGHPDTTYLYSFGPNRRRDSTPWEIRGDDLAIVVRGAVDDFCALPERQ